MKKIKIISMDFDGTLLRSDKTISDRTKKCLSLLKNKSYVIIGITARNLLSVKSTLDINLFDYIILNNGSDIYYVKEDRVENVSKIERDLAKKIFDLCNSISCQIDFCTPYKYLMKTNQKKDSRPFIKYIDKFSDVDDSISRMNVFFNNDEDLEKGKIKINNEFVDVNIVKMIDTDKKDSPKWLTINPKNTSKLNTLKRLCDELNCSVDDAIFFGDGENDLALIENVGIGVAMGNAIGSVKEKAKHITLSNDDDGVAEFLEKNILESSD